MPIFAAGTGIMETETLKKEIERLWTEAFGEEKEVTGLFLKHFYNRDRMLYTERDDRLLSMLHIVPFMLQEQKTGYIYAVATDVTERGKGLATSLMHKAVERAREMELDALALIPADDGLRAFYSRLGFIGDAKVAFDAPHGFDFGTGDSDDDRICWLPLKDDFKVAPPCDDTAILLTYTG